MKPVLNELKEELVESFKNNTLIDYISENILEVVKTGNRVDSLVFTIGGPYIYLDICENNHNGCVCGYWQGKEDFSAIPLSIWKDMEIKILDMLEAYDEETK